jgi:hypothetical protein
VEGLQNGIGDVDQRLKDVGYDCYGYWDQRGFDSPWYSAGSMGPTFKVNSSRTGSKPP